MREDISQKKRGAYKYNASDMLNVYERQFTDRHKINVKKTASINLGS